MWAMPTIRFVKTESGPPARGCDAGRRCMRTGNAVVPRGEGLCRRCNGEVHTCFPRRGQILRGTLKHSRKGSRRVVFCTTASRGISAGGCLPILRSGERGHERLMLTWGFWWRRGGSDMISMETSLIFP